MRSPSKINLRVTFSPVKPKFVVTCTSTRERARQELWATVHKEDVSPEEMQQRVEAMCAVKK